MRFLRVFAEDTVMHIHPNQTNPSAQLDAVYSAEKAAAKAAAASTRKKLLEHASEISGDAAAEEAYVVQVEPREESQPQRQNLQHKNSKKQEVTNPQEDEEDQEDHSVSDWA
jgi:hypothetical protein